MTAVQSTLTPLRRGKRTLAVLRTACGLSATLDPGKPLPMPGGVMPRLNLLGNPDGLALQDSGRFLRLARRLLQPGGMLDIAGPAPVGPFAWTADRLAWTCGFAAGVESLAASSPSGPGRRYRTPIQAEPEVPLVSVVIPAYKPDHFRAALASALDQDYSRLEILVCDDSAGEAIHAIVNEFGGMRHKVRYLRNPHTLGGRGNYLRGLEQAWGDYVKFLNDDDVLAPDCVSTLAVALRGTPGVSLATSYRRLIDTDGRPLPDQAFNVPLAPVDVVLCGEDLISSVLSSGCNRIGEPTTVMFRKSDLAAARPHAMSYHDRSALRNGDLSLWTTLLSRGDAVVVARPLSDFRLHAGQFSHDEGFRREAVRAWDILRADAVATGLLRTVDPHGAVVLSGAGAALRASEACTAAGDTAGAELAACAAARLSPLWAEPRLALAQAQWRAGRHGAALLGLACAAEGPQGAVIAPQLAVMLDAAGQHALAGAVRARGTTPIPSPS